MKNKIFLSIMLLLILKGLSAQFIDIRGYARTYEGILTESGKLAIAQQTLDMSFEKMGNKSAFKANPVLYLYDTDSLSLKLRELYTDFFFKRFDLRIGKQQVVWGKADGVFITDIVSPLDLREFLLPDFYEIRQGIIATKLNYYIGNSTIELIWVSVFTPNERPQPGSIWYIEPAFPVKPEFNYAKSDISPGIANSEVFMKYASLGSKIDFELMGAYTWDDNPSLFTKKIFDTVGGQLVLNQLEIIPEHHRLGVGGGSFGTEISGVILRGEGAYYHGKYFQTADPLAEGSLTEKDYLHYLVGADFSIGNVMLSSQIIQETILDHDDHILQKQNITTMTFLAQYDLFRETLHLELFTYLGITNEDALIRPKITYDIDDGFSVLLGANIFTGDASGTFGQYKDNSMIYTKLKYSF
ncbi:MAG: DUF1302 family protein [Bacteroidales bacterium]|nr:DUF1302 family protein [Bacteroidales bacterium]